MILALSAANKSEMIVPQLRRLRDLTGVPRLAMRLTAIASRWLFESGRPEEAVLELGALGKVSELMDSMALSLVARHTDVTDNEKREALERAIKVAACKGEEHAAQLDLASYLLATEPTSALLLVQSVIKETEGNQASAAGAAALILLWKISGGEEKFRTAFHEMEKDDTEVGRYRNAIYLIDAGKFEEAERLLANLVNKGHVQAKLMIVDVRIRCGAKESAAELFNSIDPKDVLPPLRVPYAVTMSALALATGVIQLRDRAISFLNGLTPAGGEQDKNVRSLLHDLKSMEPLK